MKIARIIEYFPPHIGGMERHGLALTQEQIKLGHEVDVFIGYGGNNANKLNAIANNANCESEINNSQHSHNIRKFALYRMPLQFLPLYGKLRRFWFNFWAFRQIKQHYKKNPYDIVHLHGDFIEAYFGGKLSKKLGIPSVLTIHAGLNKKLLGQKNRKFFDGLNRIICVSQEIADDLIKLGVAKEKIAVISSGIYLDEFKNTDENKVIDLRNRYSKPILISVGVLRVNKGFGYLINAFKEVLNKFNSATLLIIGDGPEKNNLKKQSENISNILFLGRQEHNKVIEYLQVSDVFVLASISTFNDREGTSTVVMEAMAAGLPIVATKVGGNPYLIKDNDNGFLVNPGNSSELSQTIIKLLNDSELTKKISAQNLEDIKQKDWPIIAKKIAEIYQSLL